MIGFTNPFGVIDDRFETRPSDSISIGGKVLAGQFFRGDAAFFGGVEWRLNGEWTALAEYSSDASDHEMVCTDFTRQSPLNFGVKWQPNRTYQLGAYYMYESEVGISATIIIDPKTASFPSGLETAPNPVAVRVARMLTQVAATNVDTFILELSQRGIALSAVTLSRGDLEALENEPNAAALSYDRADFGDAARPAPAIGWDDPTPAFLWGVAPYLELSLFDGDKPARARFGLEASFQYELRPNIVLAGAYRQRVLGNRDEVRSISPSTLTEIRKTGLRYGAETGGGIEILSVTWYVRPGRDFYNRFSADYLERSFGAVSGEILWKPVDSRIVLGAELNYTLLGTTT